MIEVHPDSGAMHELPNVVHGHVEDRLPVVRVDCRHVVQQDLDSSSPVGQLSGQGLLVENDQASDVSIVVLGDVLRVLQHKEVQIKAVHGL